VGRGNRVLDCCGVDDGQPFGHHRFWILYRCSISRPNPSVRTLLCETCIIGFCTCGGIQWRHFLEGTASLGERCIAKSVHRVCPLADAKFLWMCRVVQLVCEGSIFRAFASGIQMLCMRYMPREYATRTCSASVRSWARISLKSASQGTIRQ
jgi:hypothetical protein